MSASTIDASQPPRGGGDAPGRPARRRGTADRGMSRLFRWAATGSGVLLLLVLAAVAIFLLVQGWSAFTASDATLPM